MTELVTATFLFTDLVGSTALASRVGPADAERIREVHFSTLRGVIDTAGGTEVKNLGDGLMVMFTSTRLAVTCAVGMQQAFERHNRGVDEPLSIRIGIAAGEATAEQGDFFGTPVIEAARLCAACDADQILVTRTVLALGGKTLTFERRDLGGLVLKGLPEPVDTVEVLWEPEARASLNGALPSRLDTVIAGAPLGLFGREPELASIAEAAAATGGDQHVQLVAIAGEPGMGKTTLEAWASRQFAESGATVVYGDCSEELFTPFQPWIEVVRTLVDSCDDATITAHQSVHGATLGTWAPVLAAGAPATTSSSDQAGNRLRLFAAVGDLIERATTDRLVVVALDDLQWSDAASVQLLRHLVTNPLTHPVLIIIAYRDSDLSAGDPMTGFLAEMRRESNVTRLDLVGFTEAETVAFVETSAGYELTGSGIALAHALCRETKGNPFFTAAMLQHLFDTGAIDTGAIDTGASNTGAIHTGAIDTGKITSGTTRGVEPLRALDELGLPASVREVVAHRVDRLGDDTVSVLNIAAVVGLRFDFDLVVALVDLDEDTVLDVLEEATTAALVSEDAGRPGQFSFVHGLVRGALYHDLSAIRRRRLHRRIADVLETRPELNRNEPALLATHFVAGAGPGDTDQAVRYAVAAGDAAMEALSPPDAVTWYRKALDLHLGGPDHADDRVLCDLEIKLGGAQRSAGDPTHREVLLGAAALAEQLADHERSVAVALALADHNYSFTPTEDPERLAVISRALDVVPDDDIRSKVLLLAIMAEETGVAHTAERRGYAQQAVELARAGGSDELVIIALSVTVDALGGPADQKRLLTDTEWALEAAERLGDRSLEIMACHMRSLVLASWGRTAERDELLEHARQLIGTSGTIMQRGYLYQDETTQAIYHARLDEAEAFAIRHFEEWSAADAPGALLFYGSYLFVIRLVQGRISEIVDLFVDMARTEDTVATASAAATYMLCVLGRYDEAREVFAFTSEAIETYPVDVTWTTGMRCLAFAVAQLGELELAEAIYQRLAPYGHLFSNTGVTTTGSLEQPLGELAEALGRRGDAIGHFRAGITANRAAQARYWETECQLQLAEVLRRRGDDGDAEEAASLTETALESSRTHGFAGLVRRFGRQG